MFFLTEFEHTLRLPPHLLKLPLEQAITGELEKLLLDKVIADTGLCISVYDIKSIQGGLIAPGEGAATYNVKFRLIMFRPFDGEIISAKLKEYDAKGLQSSMLYFLPRPKFADDMSLGFFDDIYIPATFFPHPSTFEPHPDDPNVMIWVYRFSEDQTSQIDPTDEIRFRVKSVMYPAVPVEQAEGSKPFSPMVITGSIEDDGLGPVSWWG